MKSARTLAIMAAVAGIGVAVAAPATREERDAIAKSPPPERLPKSHQRVKPPRNLTERDVERLTAANDKRARRAARNLKVSQQSVSPQAPVTGDK